MNSYVWLGIILCLVQSAIFSGLTIGLFGLSLLRLEVQAEMRNEKAIKILELRKDAHFLLATLLWGNVSVNVLLTLLSGSVLTGVGAFIFSTVGITIFGEIVPQAFYARHALIAAPIMIPLIRAYQIILFPVAKLTALLLDAWLGKEAIGYFQEHEFKILLKKHVQSEQSNIDLLEGLGAVNFLALDDIRVEREGEVLEPGSILALPVESGLPVFPDFKKDPKDPFLQKVHASKKKWVIITDEVNKPIVVLDAHKFLRHAMYGEGVPNPYRYCHRPIIVTSSEKTLGQVIRKLKVHPEHSEDDVIDHDLILFWGETKRIITGADILGRLLRGIVTRVNRNI